MRVDFLGTIWRAIPSIKILDAARATDVKWTVVTDGKWGSENTPVMLATDLDETFAKHIVSLHNNCLEAKS